ncbi:hypothetical protein CEUSTIGMA_g9437.t1 [Chlamydomonas eustigma]|uniref:Beta-catenin-like protein 1 N-terminal domain-containing protein n=1 Tax=Chlamydomonas eustigma TaxID=1157962 RepID=A0A250XGH3_9CHLO|nr:hypothetical protein CEUSTIGMA_g9437.t1 [Chlamydomonas eustigma]|eukprot:GAX82009.1 hypothetical protein CEUSTIGMA_g9437.t1 [Chlamydomonas eustigma]
MDARGASRVLNAVVNSVLNDGASDHVSYVPAIKFLGARPGYLFKNGDKGLGYYSDKKLEKSVDQGPEEPEDGVEHSRKTLTAEELLKQAEDQANVEEIQLLDAKGLKRLGLAFLRKYKDNMEQRMKHAEQPERFLDSEVDLDEHIKSLLQVAGSPEMYPILIDMGCIPTLLACLSHENTDIAADTLELFMELTGADAVEDYHEEARALVEAMLESNALELLVQRLLSLDEKVEEEAKAVFNCLTTFQNMVEVEPKVAEQLVDKTRLLKWLLTRIRPREFDSNKLEASELLAILVQGNERIQKRIGEIGGIDTLLQCVAMYKSRDPSTAEEEEFMQNCFDLLCSCLMIHDNKAVFVKSEGVELVWIMLQSKKQSRYGAVKLLDFSTTRFPQPCEKLVDLGGLKHLFGIFMGKARIKGPRGGRDVEMEVEERSVSIIFNLFQTLGSKGGRRERLAAKFVESEFEKCDRLMELFFRYAARVSTQEAKLAELALDDGDEETDPEEILMARMDAGLFTLQQCAIIVAHLWSTTDTGLRKRIIMLLHQKGQALANIKDVLLEYYRTIGMEGGLEEQQRVRSKVKELLSGMGMPQGELETVQEGQLKGPETEPLVSTEQQQKLNGGTEHLPSSVPAAARKPEPVKDVEEEDNDGMDMDMDVEEDKKRKETSSQALDRHRDLGGSKEAGRREEKSVHPGKSQRDDRDDKEYRRSERESDRSRHHDRDRGDRGRDRDKEEEREHRKERRRSRSR